MFDLEKIHGANHHYPGLFVVAEGMDGVGKTSLLISLRERLSGQGYAVQRTALPTRLVTTSTLFQSFVVEGRHDEVDFEAFQLLHMADRLQHSAKVIKPLLEQGMIVLCDRYFHSTVVTMVIHISRVFEWFPDLVSRVIHPDTTFILDCDYGTCLDRIRRRANKFEPKLSWAQFDRRRRAYQMLGSLDRTILIDTTHMVYDALVDRATEIVMGAIRTRSKTDVR